MKIILYDVETEIDALAAVRAAYSVANDRNPPEVGRWWGMGVGDRMFTVMHNKAGYSVRLTQKSPGQGHRNTGLDRGFVHPTRYSTLGT